MWNFVGIVGTVIELVGFIIISWDLLPEYSQYKSRKALRRLAMLIADKSWLADRQRMLDELKNAQADPVRKGLDQMLIQMDLSDRAIPFDEEDDRWKRTSDIANEELPELLRHLEKKSVRLEAKLEKRNRPPIVSGIFIVILGVLVQIFGQLPGSVRCPVLHNTPVGSIACEGVDMTTR